MDKKRVLIVWIVGLTVVFCVFCTGFFLGRRTVPTVAVSAQGMQRAAADTQAQTIAAQEPAPDAGTAERSTQPAQATQESGGLLNINTATASELEALPGIGEVLAQRIIAFREEHGAFTDVTQLTLVDGIGEKKLAAIMNLITTG